MFWKLDHREGRGKFRHILVIFTVIHNMFWHWLAFFSDLIHYQGNITGLKNFWIMFESFFAKKKNHFKIGKKDQFFWHHKKSYFGPLNKMQFIPAISALLNTFLDDPLSLFDDITRIEQGCGSSLCCGGRYSYWWNEYILEAVRGLLHWWVLTSKSFANHYRLISIIASFAK